MGYPITDESGATGGRDNGFQGGAIVWSPASGDHETHGAIRARWWAAQDFERGPPGLPVTDEFSIPGCRQSTFQHGYITWNATTGATQVH